MSKKGCMKGLSRKAMRRCQSGVELPAVMIYQNSPFWRTNDQTLAACCALQLTRTTQKNIASAPPVHVQPKMRWQQWSANCILCRVHWIFCRVHCMLCNRKRGKAKFPWKEVSSHLLDCQSHKGSRSDSFRAPTDLSKEEFRKGRVGKKNCSPYSGIWSQHCIETHFLLVAPHFKILLILAL